MPEIVTEATREAEKSGRRQGEASRQAEPEKVGHRQAAPPFPNDVDRYMREREVAVVTGLSRSSRWRMTRLGLFPAPRRIGMGPNGATAHLRSEIMAWMASRQTVTEGETGRGRPRKAG